MRWWTGRAPGAARALVPALATVLTLACGGERADEPDPPGRTDADGELLVSAASSLTDAFAEVAAAFEETSPGVAVTLNLAGSSTLAGQIAEGAPVDVFASANLVVMEGLVEAGRVAGEPRVFARNTLRIAVPPGNPTGIAGLADFARDELVLGLCAPAVPCGAAAREALAQAGVEPRPDTEEPSARALLTKVELGELDAAVTWATDVAAAGGAVQGIDLPSGTEVVSDYTVAVVSGAPRPDAARTFVALLLSDEGRAILARHGFLLP